MITQDIVVSNVGILIFEDTGVDSVCCAGEHFSVLAPTDCGCPCHKVKTDRFGYDENGELVAFEQSREKMIESD